MNITKIQDAVDRALIEADITDCKPVDIELMAKKIGFVVKRIQFRSISSKIQGLMLLDSMPGDMQKKIGSNKLILLNSEYDVKHQRFVVAHELGHYYLHRDECKNKKNPVFAQIEDDEIGIEAEACRFAAMILMDEKIFSSAYKELKNNSENREIEIIRNLSAQFEVPQMAVKRRIAELNLGDETCVNMMK